MSESSSMAPIRPDPIPRARPVIELNLNVEEAMIEAVDLLRTIRVQMEAITSTVNQRLNRTFSDAGEDVTKIIHNVETLSSNLAASTGQLYQPLLFSLLFLLIFLILLGTLVCIFCHVRKQVKSRNGKQKKLKKAKKSSEKEAEEGIVKGEELEEDIGEEKPVKSKKRQPFGLFERFRRGRRRYGSKEQSPPGSRSPELEELREKGGPKGSVEFHEAGTLRQQP